MKPGFRQSMAWLHTWSGLVVGWVLYFVFVTGTIGFFYVEIDRWMRPELPLQVDLPLAPQWLATAEAYLRRAAPHADTWTVHLPGGRPEGANYADIRWRRDAGAQTQDHRLMFDAEVHSFREMTARGTGGGHLLYRMHWQLHYVSRRTGPLIVGLCSMIMLVALLTGTIMHRRIFVDLLTFRPGTGPRAWLDAHTVASVLALPFFLMITYSGLVFFADTYMPVAGVFFNEDDGQQVAEPLGRTHGRAPSDPAPLLPFEFFRTAAVQYWGANRVRTIQVSDPGEAHAEVHVIHNGKGMLLRDVGEELHFSGVDGHLLRQVTARRSVVRQTQSVLFGLHEGIFAGPVLRWLYFLAGLLGCAMVATGLVLWTVKRRATSMTRGGSGVWHTVVERLNIGTIAGLPVGIAVYFWANRLLAVSWADRATWEVHSMFLAWGLMVLYPVVRSPQRAWVEECSIGGCLFALLPVVNAFTTDRHLGVTIPAGDWALAGFDLTVLGLGLVLCVVATGIHRRLANLPTARRTLVPAVAQEGG